MLVSEANFPSFRWSSNIQHQPLSPFLHLHEVIMSQQEVLEILCVMQGKRRAQRCQVQLEIFSDSRDIVRHAANAFSP